MLTAARWLARRAEDIAALMMTAMFLTFLYQIAMRYVFNAPAAWAEEICVTAWLWVVLWGTALVTREPDTIRIDLLRNALSLHARRVVDAACGLALALIFGLGLPGAWAYVSFMKIEGTAALGWRFNLVFSVYLLFALAVIARQAWTVVEVWRPPRAATA
jgi:TRAP-type C4-dicarboxylate transport system permease small subunit